MDLACRPPQISMRRFYAAPGQFAGDRVELSLEESRHLRDVLRLAAGEEAAVFDGEGREFRCTISETGRAKHPAILQVTGEIAPKAPESSLDLTLAIALLKGEKFDLVIQKATELGVDKIIPLLTLRTDVKVKADDVHKKLERWQRIALEAVKQCGRAKIPEIAAPISFAQMFESTTGQRIFFAEMGGRKLDALPEALGGEITAIVGPEGGWDESELAVARERNCHLITLGGRILRAETAGIVVCALLQNIFGDLN
jgi:16S rRNA (uracil1498-N3)-methyltransferase